jgi:hypothetical protein
MPTATVSVAVTIVATGPRRAQIRDAHPGVVTRLTDEVRVEPDAGRPGELRVRGIAEHRGPLVRIQAGERRIHLVIARDGVPDHGVGARQQEGEESAWRHRVRVQGDPVGCGEPARRVGRGQRAGRHGRRPRRGQHECRDRVRMLCRVCGRDARTPGVPDQHDAIGSGEGAHRIEVLHRAVQGVPARVVEPARAAGAGLVVDEHVAVGGECGERGCVVLHVGDAGTAMDEDDGGTVVRLTGDLEHAQEDVARCDRGGARDRVRRQALPARSQPREAECSGEPDDGDGACAGNQPGRRDRDREQQRDRQRRDQHQDHRPGRTGDQDRDPRGGGGCHDRGDQKPHASSTTRATITDPAT